MNGEIAAWLGAEDMKNVVYGVGRYTSRLEFHWIAVREEAFPRRVQPQFLVDLCLLLGFRVRVLAQLAVMTQLFLYADR